MRPFKWLSLLLTLCLLLPGALAEDIGIVIDDEVVVEVAIGEEDAGEFLQSGEDAEGVPEVGDLELAELEPTAAADAEADNAQATPAEATNAEAASNDAGDVALTESNFPDASFRSYLSEWDRDGDGVLSESELEKIKSIDVSEKMVQSLKGIEFFPNLTDLNCSDNLLTSLDVSGNVALKSLSCCRNQLTALDISGNPRLWLLYCDSNQLTALDVSRNTALETLSCYKNQLTALNLSNNTLLRSLDCIDNQLTSLDVSGNTALQSLYCSKNQLTALDLSNNTLLESLDCDNNQLTSLDVSNNTLLESLDCDNNQLTSLDISRNTALQSLYCYKNQLTSLNVSGKTALKNLYCSKNQLTSLDLSGDSSLCKVDCYDNNLTTLDLSNFNPAVQALFTEENTELYGDTVRIGNDSYYVECDSFIELTMNGAVLRPQGANGIALGPKEKKLGMGDTFQLVPIFEPARARPALTWTSSNPKYATVDQNGLVTARKKGGSATITVTTPNGLTASAVITVKAQPSKVTLNKSGTTTLTLGKTLKLKATLPKNTAAILTWKSSKPGIAAVDQNGLVTPIKKGTATITVRARNGKKAQVKVKVVAPTPTKVVLAADKTTLAVKEKLALKAIFAPEYAESKLTWASSNKKVATVSKKGVVTAQKKGTATITVKTANGKKATIKITVQ